MGIISRYLARLAALTRPIQTEAEAISADIACLHIGGERLAWEEVQRIDAYKREIYAADLSCLAILSTEDRVVEINEEMRGWNEVANAIERHLRGSLPYAVWALQLIAAKPGGSVRVYSTGIRSDERSS